MDGKRKNHNKPFFKIEIKCDLLNSVSELFSAFVNFICAWLQNIQDKWENNDINSKDINRSQKH